ncbi:uncharacterized protein LOC100679201 isoform X2 [Nasonia vitripennis]|uniref:Uncharacterized protein n=1 Tax=Nasonia vitripennis TaxID=7425 RepID=A0A7M7GL13_NASVI|nr:uncharacterized protein LOC100679201 isoform X2 [Nasonia vitripennis]
MEEQEEKSPTVATQTEPTAVCHQGTSVNEFLLATGNAILTTERIRVKCYSVLYGRASRYVPAPLDNEFQSGIYTQTPRKTGKAEMVQVQPGKNNPPRKNCQYNRAKAGKFTKSEAHTAHSTQTPSSGIAVSSPNGGLKLSKNAKRKLNKKFKKIARMYDAQADKPAIEITRATHYRLNFI